MPEHDAATILHKRYVGDDPQRQASVEAERTATTIAEDLRRLRMEAGLTQKELAARLGTTQSVVSRWENPNYDRHTLRSIVMLARAMGYAVSIQFTATAADLAPKGGPK